MDVSVGLDVWRYRTLYSVLGWMPVKTPGNMVGWRPLPPAAEREEAERHIQELRAAQSHIPMDY